VYTSLGGPPWLLVIWPKPRPGSITARTATIAATTATAAQALDPESLLIALFLSCDSRPLSKGAGAGRTDLVPSERALNWGV
jgi:hypothetical protein